MTKTRQWAIFTLVAVLVVFAGGYELLVSPQRSKAADLRTEAAGDQSQLSTLHAQLAQLQAEKKNLPEQQKILAQIATKIPADPDEPTLIRQLQSAESTAGVDMTTLTPGTPTAYAATAAVPTTGTPTTGTTGSGAPALYDIPLSIDVTGSYFNDEMFLHTLESLPRALISSAITEAPAATAGSSGATGSTSGTSTGSDTQGDVTMTITAEVFLSPTNAPATPALPSTGGTAATTS